MSRSRGPSLEINPQSETKFCPLIKFYSNVTVQRSLFTPGPRQLRLTYIVKQQEAFRVIKQKHPTMIITV